MSPDREYALYLARVEEPTLNSNGEVSKRMSIGYKCAECQDRFSFKDINVDHIDAVGIRPDTLDGLPNWINRLFCSYKNLQVLCKPCHKIKSQVDMRGIRQDRKKRKETKNGDMEKQLVGKRVSSKRPGKRKGVKKK